MSLALPSALKVRRRVSPQLIAGAVAFVAVALFMLVRSPVFFMPGNIINVLVQTGMLAILATVNPGDEVVAADPYFVMYPNMVALAGGTFVGVDTAPSFRIDPDRLIAACTLRTKMILLCSPSNPTGAIV